MRCPICNKTLTEAMREARPFCSSRCKQVDLGKWLNGEYAIPGTEQDSSDSGEVPQQPKDEK
ncbi:DNA gyrase inhibitor YacG [Pendulispora rubella]|uniref:DNA gyrase inhibitor YacG n=1 Tax=Pendulispora rubella TaxID=2741070 RepID=A0ABZ2KVU2_9BACT